MAKLENYAKFRTEVMDLKRNLGLMVCKMDGVFNNDNLSVQVKEEKLQALSDEYLVV